MIDVKPGLRLRSRTCTTEAIVIKGAGALDVRCGGQLMASFDERPTRGTPRPPFDSGTAVGKRYVTADGAIELLCTKAGEGALAVGDESLVQKDAKPLPASD